MKPIRIYFIPQNRQKYSTVGNYGEEPDHIWFEITRFDNPIYSVAVLLHELYEFFRCKQQGVNLKDIDWFEMEGPGNDADDPGWLPEAPYHSQHAEADVIERACIALSGNDWTVYANTIEELFK